MFEIDMEEGFPQRELRILSLWKERNFFQKSLDHRKNAPFFSFYDGPPFATGLPHYGHILAGTIKDVVPRYKTMKGYLVPRRFGWDCHGLPVENEIEKSKELSGAASIEAFGIANFNEECRSIVLRYASEWKKTVDRMGRWVDFDHAYKTMDLPFMESVWWVFSELYKKGLVYEGLKVMPFSLKLGTPLSNFEANLNYKDVDDPSITVACQLVENPQTYFLLWTTTPWTLPSNLALMVAPSHYYVKIKDHKTNRFYILGESRISHYFTQDFEIVERFLGSALISKKYVPIFPFFESAAGAFRVIGEDSISLDDGTGIVHSAPAFGEVDFFACKREGIEIVCPVDSNGKFTQEVPPYAGMLVKDADKKIIRDLKEKKLLFHQATIRHRYPFCWRSDTPLIYKAVRTWFVAVEKIKDKLLAANEQIYWVPNYIKEGRFGKWLENARDWAISRNRYWGTPIPLWRSDDGDLLCIESVSNLEKLTNHKITDLHRHFIDDLVIQKEGKIYRRIPEVFDCWFESGSMPYAELHYPFENTKAFEKRYPADFIAEGLDQTRGWFYTLTVLSAALFDKPAFKNVLVNGIILAEDGNKMSKRLKNYPDPELILDRYGADALRLYMLGSPAVKGDDLRFVEKGVEHALRQVLIPLWNSFVFLSTYAKIYQWTPRLIEQKPHNPIDRWILSLTEKLISDVEKGMDLYELNTAVGPFVGFVDQLTNWYIRRSRSRFWADEDSLDRREAFATLYTVLIKLSQVAAPFIPFLSEALYQELKTIHMPESVHLCDFPKYHPEWRDLELEKDMEATQIAVNLGHALRKEYKCKVRQPLGRLDIITSDAALLHSLRAQQDLIADELNVKQIQFHQDETAFVSWFGKPNFPILGKKIGKKMGQAQKAIQALTATQLQKLGQSQSISIALEDGEHLSLEPEDVQVERKVKEGMAAGNTGNITLAFDLHLTEELLLEGLARELVNKVNTMRRDLGLDVVDRIRLTIDTTERMKTAFSIHQAYIEHEVLATQTLFEPCDGTAIDLNGEASTIAIYPVKK